MIIACIGWGSLIWDPKELPVRRGWFDDVPFIPVEFVRQSDNGRITLVIDTESKSKAMRTLWAVMDTDNLENAKEALKAREGRKAPIGDWEKGKNDPENISGLTDWATAHGVDAVIWTGLGAKFNNVMGARPSVGEVISYLKGLEGRERDAAEEYVRRTPPQIDTAYRRKIEAELGWTPLSNGNR